MKNYFYNTLAVFTLSLCSFTTHADTIVGSLEGDIEVNQGAVSWGMGIDVPSGVNGISPNLSLKYNQSGNNGPLGLAFNLSGLSSITRCPASKKLDGMVGGIQFDKNDRYCMDGQRLIAINGQPGANNTEYRTAIESYSKIISYGAQGSYGPTHWEVWGKDGSITSYGAKDHAKLTVTKAQNAVLSWKIDSQKDRFNNEIRYTYGNKAGVQSIERIDYSGHSINFVYEERSDVLNAWQMGEARNLTGRLKTIEVNAAGQSLHNYQLSYSNITEAEYSRLESIALCTDDGACTKPTTFKWKPGASYDESQQQIEALDITNFSTYRLIDLNNDGAQDMCYLSDGLSCALNDGSGQMGSATKWTSALDDGKWSHPDQSSTLTFMDINNDTYLDYCIQDTTGIFCGTHNHNKGFEGDKYWTQSFKRKQEIRYFDLNNDRLTDICEIKADKVECAYNTGSSYGERFQLLSDGWQSTDDPNSTIGFIDIDGDGLTDLCGFDSKGYRCAISKGYDSNDRLNYALPVVWGEDVFTTTSTYNGFSFSTGLVWNNEFHIKSFRYADLNSDGLIDMCYSRFSEVNCALNNGTGFEAFTKWGTTHINWLRSLSTNISSNDDGACLKFNRYQWRWKS